MKSYFHLQWKEFPTPMADSSFCYFRENLGMILAKPEWWNKANFLVRASLTVTRTFYSLMPAGHSRNHILWRENVLKSLYSKGDTQNWGKKQKTNLTFPMILEDEKVWTVESGQLLTQGCSESPAERRISSNPGINKGKELWGDSTLKLKRFNIGC